MLRLETLTVEASQFRLSGVDLSVASGEYAVLMGETGCGKTTLLEAICGLRRVAQGIVWVGNRNVTRAAIADRHIGYVPQDGAVFPTMTVRDNLAFAPKVRGHKRDAIRAETDRLAGRLSIDHLLDRRAVGLSGGEMQRVALGRALATKPELLLLDEPLSALDESTRRDMVRLLKTIQQETGVTTLHVTHSQSEAEQLADALFVFDGRRITTDRHGGNAKDPTPVPARAAT